MNKRVNSVTSNGQASAATEPPTPIAARMIPFFDEQNRVPIKDGLRCLDAGSTSRAGLAQKTMALSLIDTTDQANLRL